MQPLASQKGVYAMQEVSLYVAAGSDRKFQALRVSASVPRVSELEKLSLL